MRGTAVNCTCDGNIMVPACDFCNARQAAKADHRHEKGDGSWWEKDALGIPLCRVCPDCRDEKLARYRPEILSGYSQADVDEPIEPD